MNHGKLNMVSFPVSLSFTCTNLFLLDDGSCNEIYMDKPPAALIGLSFKEAAWVSYHTFYNSIKKKTINPCGNRLYILNVK